MQTVGKGEGQPALAADDRPAVRVERDGNIGWIVLDRPDQINAINDDIRRGVPAALAALEADAGIRVIVIRGEGPRGFCAGADIKERRGAETSLQVRRRMEGARWIEALDRTEKPVIAAIHGYCIGAGLDMATACDIRLCSADASFSLREAAVGFVADVGVLQRIPNIVGQGVARELAYTAKNIDAKRAKEVLLVNEVFENQEALMAGAEKMAMEIVANSPLAVQASKEVLNYGVGKTVDEGLKYVASISANIIPSNDLFEAMTAMMEKRKPNFTGK
jgi:enoyl-CoA hydratase